MSRAVQRYLGLGLLLAIASFTAGGYFSIRRDVENLRVISQDNILWTATQMEVELLRFRLSVATLDIEGTQAALDEVRARFDILWSRIFMMSSGRVGELIRRYDEGHDSIPAFQAYLRDLDAVVVDLAPDDTARIRAIVADLDAFQHALRLYTLRVVRGDTAATAAVRESIQFSSQTTMLISMAAVLLSLLALGLILRDNRRQREVAELNRQIAIEAELSSRAKSRFLTMMSHELRNPLNGVLGPLALLGQADLPTRYGRLVQQAQQSGKSMVQMLAGLLDYGEMQDGRFALRVEPFRPGALVAAMRAELEGVGAGGVRVTLRPETPELLYGDVERLRHVFLHLIEYVLEGSGPESIDVALGYAEGALTGEIGFAVLDPAVDWKLDLMMGLNEIAPDQFSTEALRPLIARGLIAEAKGGLTLALSEGGGRAIRVSIPAEEPHFARVRVRLVSRSAALEAIYRAALRSEQIVFVAADDPEPVEMVLIDATSIADEDLMAHLRKRFPDALFVSLGAPQTPDAFDDVVASPADMTRLRSSILRRIAS